MRIEGVHHCYFFGDPISFGPAPLLSEDAFAVWGRINLAKLVKFLSLRIQLNQKYSDYVCSFCVVRGIQILTNHSPWTS